MQKRVTDMVFLVIGIVVASLIFDAIQKRKAKKNAPAAAPAPAAAAAE